MSMNHTLGGFIAKGIENPKVLMGGAALAGLYMFNKSGAHTTEKAAQKLFESLPADAFAPRGMSAGKTVGIVASVVGALSTIGIMGRVAFMHGKLKSESKGIWNAIKASWYSAFGNHNELNKLVTKAPNKTYGPNMQKYIENEKCLEDGLKTSQTQKSLTHDNLRNTQRIYDEYAKNASVDPILLEITKSNQHINIYQQRLKNLDAYGSLSSKYEDKNAIKNKLKISETPKKHNDYERAIEILKQIKKDQIDRVKMNTNFEFSKDLIAELESENTGVPGSYATWLINKNSKQFTNIKQTFENQKNHYQTLENQVQTAQKALDEHRQTKSTVEYQDKLIEIRNYEQLKAKNKELRQKLNNL